MRHGRAEEESGDGSDASRRLTPEGEERIRNEAAGLKYMCVRPDLILASTRLRARQTAEIVAQALGSSLTLESKLAHGCSLSNLAEVLARHLEPESVLVVGHNPDMSLIAGSLVGGKNLALSPGGVVFLETDLEPGKGRLVKLLTPEALMAAGAHLDSWEW